MLENIKQVLLILYILNQNVDRLHNLRVQIEISALDEPVSPKREDILLLQMFKVMIGDQISEVFSFVRNNEVAHGADVVNEHLFEILAFKFVMGNLSEFYKLY